MSVWALDFVSAVLVGSRATYSRAHTTWYEATSGRRGCSTWASGTDPPCRSLGSAICCTAYGESSVRACSGGRAVVDLALSLSGMLHGATLRSFVAGAAARVMGPRVSQGARYDPAVAHMCLGSTVAVSPLPPPPVPLHHCFPEVCVLMLTRMRIGTRSCCKTRCGCARSRSASRPGDGASRATLRARSSSSPARRASTYAASSSSSTG